MTGDFAGSMEHVSLVAKSGLDVYAHNVETVEALTPFVRDRRATFRQSLKVLEQAKNSGVRVTKTSMMLGVGENEEQIMDALKGSVPLSFSNFTPLIFIICTHRIAEGARRRCYVWSIHETYETTYESRPIC